MLISDLKVHKKSDSVYSAGFVFVLLLILD